MSLLHRVVEAVSPTVCRELMQTFARLKAAGGKGFWDCVPQPKYGAPMDKVRQKALRSSQGLSELQWDAIRTAINDDLGYLYWHGRTTLRELCVAYLQPCQLARVTLRALK